MIVLSNFLRGWHEETKESGADQRQRGGHPLRGVLLYAGALILTVLGPNAARADDYIVPDVVVFCEPTLLQAITDVGALWRGRTKIPVRIFATPTEFMLEQISHGIRSDVVIGMGPAAEAIAIKRSIIKPETATEGWRNRLVVARRTDGAASPIQNVSSAFLTGAGNTPTAIVDAGFGSTGADTRQALDGLGLSNGLASHVIGAASTADAIFLLLHGKARSAIVYATDVAANPLLARAAVFPDESYPAITYWIAETKWVRSPNAPKFAAFLRSKEAQERLRADGLEVAP